MVEISLSDLILWFFLILNDFNGSRMATEEQIKRFVRNVKEKVAREGKVLVSTGCDYMVLGELFQIINLDGDSSKLWALRSTITKSVIRNSINNKNDLINSLFSDYSLVEFVNGPKRRRNIKF